MSGRPLTFDAWLAAAAALPQQGERLARLRAARKAHAPRRRAAWDRRSPVWAQEAKRRAEHIGHARDLEGALAIIAAVYPLTAVCHDTAGEALLLRAWANVLQYHEQYEDCLLISGVAVALYRQRGETYNVAVAQMVQVGALGALERFDEALALAGEIGPAFEQSGSRLARGVLANALGRIYTALWRLDEARPQYELARQLFLADKQTRHAAWALHNIGHLAARQDNPRQAEEILLQAYEEFVADGDLVSAVKCRFNLARVMIFQARLRAALGHLDAARSHLAQVAALRRERGEAALPDSGYVDQLEAEVRAHLHEYAEAESLLRRALALFDELGRKLETAETQVKLALLLAGEGSAEKIAEALALLKAAIALSGGLGAPLFAAWVRLIQAEILLHLTRRAEAHDLAGQAAAAFRQAGLRLRLAQALATQADGLAGDEPGAARALYGEALAHIGQDAALVAVRCRQGLGRLALDEGDAPAAEADYRRAAAILEELRFTLAGHAQKARFLENKQALYEELLTAIMAQPGREAELLEQVERHKAGALAELLLGRPPDPTTDPAVRALMDERDRLAVRLDHHLAALDNTQLGGPAGDAPSAPTLAAHDQYAAHQAALLRRQLRTLEEDIAGRHDPAADWRAMPAASAANIHALLDEQTCLIAYFATRDGAVAALTAGHTPGDVVIHPLAVDAATLAVEWRKARPRMNTPAARAYLGRLYDWLIRPLEARLRGHARLLILPHRDLFLLPFAAFFDSRQGAYLVERWSPQLAPSATVLAWCQGQPAPGRGALLVGYPGLPDTPDFLSGVEQEIARLAGRLPHAVQLLGPEATEERLMAQAGGNEIIHLAGHAYFNALYPLESGMPLMGGPWLRASDLFMRYGLLGGATVVLSGCQTGQGEPAGSEVLGLISAFLYAGARGVISSLWKADDAATVELMDALYAGLTQGQPTAAALRQAQLALLGSASHQTPYFWGGFQLTGAEARLAI